LHHGGTEAVNKPLELTIPIDKREKAFNLGV
jgi:hypothetical protein